MPGWVVIVGGVEELFTVSVAAVVVAVPAAFVNTTRYWFPFCDKVVVKLSVVEVAPETLLNVTPPSVLTCHCTVGVGEPVAAAVKVAVWPALTVWLAGCVVIVGGVGEFTVSVAVVVVAVPAEFVNTARYRFPFCDEAVVKLRVVEVAAETLLNVPPPSVLTCHCTVGVGEPVAAAVKVAVWPTVSVWFVGCVVIVGVVFEGVPILKIWFAEPMQVFCSIFAPDVVEAPTTSRHPLVMLAERIW